MIHEKLTASDYTIRETHKSRIDPRNTLTVETGIRCPHCGRVGPWIEHGLTRMCDCGLSMTRYGNTLDCLLREG